MKDVKKIRRLPGFWLGTRKPTSLGYQRNQGIGTPQFTSVAGEDIQPEVNAMQNNYIPNALQKLTQNVQQPITALSNRTTIPATAAATAAYNSSISQLANTGMSTAVTPGEQAMWAAASQKAAQNGFTAPGKTALNALGKGAAIAGTLYGLGNMTSDILHAGDNRTAGDMENTLATNTYYTPGGHAYTQRGGLNLSAEQAYGNAQKRNTQTSFLLDSMGTGLSAGTFVSPGIGSLIGTGIGTLVGLGGMLFGLGDNSEDIEREATRLMDSTARSDKQSRALAFNQDTRDAFAKRGAADGKTPGKKANAYVSHGETNVHADGTYETYPGRPDKKDTLLRHVKDSDTIFSNNKYVTDESASEYFQRTQDYAGAYAIDEANRNYIMNKKEEYKCGKKPKYALGTTGEYGLAVLPHFGEFFQALASENRARKADTYVPQMELQSPEQYAAINQVQSDMLNPTDYLRRFNREFNMANWNVRRNPGLGYGGRAIASSDLFGKKLSAYSDLWLKLQEANRAQRNTAANMRFNLGDKMLSTQYDQFWKRAALSQQANAAKENWMEQARKNQVMAGINAAADALRMAQYNKSLGIQNRMIDLYGDQANRDWFKLRAEYPQYDWNPENILPEIIRKHGYKPQLGWDDMA